MIFIITITFLNQNSISQTCSDDQKKTSDHRISTDSFTIKVAGNFGKVKGLLFYKYV